MKVKARSATPYCFVTLRRSLVLSSALRPVLAVLFRAPPASDIYGVHSRLHHINRVAHPFLEKLDLSLSNLYVLLDWSPFNYLQELKLRTIAIITCSHRIHNRLRAS